MDIILRIIPSIVFTYVFPSENKHCCDPDDKYKSILVEAMVLWGKIRQFILGYVPICSIRTNRYQMWMDNVVYILKAIYW